MTLLTLSVLYMINYTYNNYLQDSYPNKAPQKCDIQ